MESILKIVRSQTRKRTAVGTLLKKHLFIKKLSKEMRSLSSATSNITGTSWMIKGNEYLFSIAGSKSTCGSAQPMPKERANANKPFHVKCTKIPKTTDPVWCAPALQSSWTWP